MRINYQSDLHLEFGPLTEQISGEVLILAGDITVKERHVDWINDQLNHFNHIIYIIGNHEYYRGDIVATDRKLALALDERIHFLRNSSVTINGVTFHGSTLWSSFDNGNPISYMNAANEMNDYRIIRDDDYRLRFTPQRAHMLHNECKVFLRENIKEGDVVVTHMAPSFQSIHEVFKGSNVNGSYASNLEDLILDTKPSHWIHGHTHMSMNYMVGDTNVLCNPRGYVAYEENPDFNLEASFNV